MKAMKFLSKNNHSNTPKFNLASLETEMPLTLFIELDPTSEVNKHFLDSSNEKKEMSDHDLSRQPVVTSTETQQGHVRTVHYNRS